MTNPGEDAGETASSDSGSSASEPEPGGHESPPIKKTDDQAVRADEQPTVIADQPTRAFERPAPQGEQPGQPPAPAYDASGSAAPAYPPGGFPPPDAYPPPPPAGAGYPPPPPPVGAPPAGFGPPPPPGYPGSGYLLPEQKTNAMATASIAVSGISIPLYLICFLGFFGSIAGIVLGVIALNQIKDSGEQGKGLAIAGIVISGVTILLALAVGVLILSMSVYP